MAAWEGKKEVFNRISEKPRIALCLPHTGTFSAEFVESVWGPLKFRPLDWCVKLPFLSKASSLTYARNNLAQAALDAGATHMLWIDADSVCESFDGNEALRQLFNCNAPIAGCLYIAKQKRFNYAAWIKGENGYISISSWTGNWFTVDVTGMHFILIRREVFENTSKPWFHWEDEGPSEDFYFFEKARKAGFKVNIFSEVKCSHIGMLKVLSDKTVTTPDV